MLPLCWRAHLVEEEKKEQRISHVSDVYFHHHTNLHLKPLQYGKLTVDEHKNSDIFRFWLWISVSCVHQTVMKIPKAEVWLSYMHSWGIWVRQREQRSTGKRMCTSKRSTEAAAHPDSTTDRQDVCVTVWILLIQRGGGVSIETTYK